MVLGIKELWDSVSDAVVKIKDLFVGFKRFNSSKDCEGLIW